MENKLSELMGAGRININKLSADTGISRTTISSIYNQKSKNINLKTLISICNYFNVPLHDLIDYVPSERN